MVLLQVEIPVQVAKLRRVGQVMAALAFLRFALNSRPSVRAADHFMATSSLVPAILLELGQRKGGSLSLQYLALIALSAVVVLMLEISNFITQYPHVIITIAAGILPSSLFLMRAYALLRDSLAQVVLSSERLRLDHYQLLLCLFLRSYFFSFCIALNTGCLCKYIPVYNS